MEILVCVKQVPASGNVEVDPVTGVIKRDGAAAKLNPYDLFALETAFSLCEQYGGRVRTLSMGPPQARESLLETLYMGAEEATLLSDRCFAGADVAATSYALQCGVAAMGPFDLILCGKQTTDGDTAQVGPELAERLGLDHAANVLRIDALDLSAAQPAVTVTLDLDERLQTQRMLLPCLLSMEKDVNTPRLPSYRRKCALEAAQLKVWDAAALAGLDPARCGLKGSPTQVERIFPPEKNAEKQLYTGEGAQLADTLCELLRARKLI